MNMRMNTATAVARLDPAAIAPTDREDALAIYADLIACCEPQPFTAADWDKPYPSPVDTAADEAYEATKKWMALYQEQGANPGADMYSALFDAHRTMRERHAIHADAVEIEAIGELDGGRSMRPGYYGMGLAVYDDGADEPLMYVPRGLGRETIFFLLRTHDAAYAAGRVDGRNEIRMTFHSLLEIERA